MVYLTARDVDRGTQAVLKLKELGFNPEFHQLDTTDLESIKKFRDHIITAHGGFDLLVNNAGMAYKVGTYIGGGGTWITAIFILQSLGNITKF